MQLGKKKHFNSFSDNCGYCFLVSHWNSTSGYFLKVSGNVESKIKEVNFGYSVTFKICWPIMHFERSLTLMWFFYYHGLDNSKILLHYVMQIFPMLTHFIIQYKNYFLICLYHQKSFYVLRSCQVHWGSFKFFKFFISAWKFEFFDCQNCVVIFLSWSDRLISFISKKMPVTYP